ncbi:MAG: GNAT family N-acetyltransferase [Magnetococcales bacterium]|nr:GNAT family N-acetyltransferase [Magnetococcales bacterium]
MAVRPVTPADFDQVLAWRNDAHTRAMSRRSQPLSLDQYQPEMENPEALFLIAEIRQSGGGSPVEAIGVVRFDPLPSSEPTVSEKPGFEVGINLAPSARGRGLAAPVLIAAVAAFRSVNTPRPFLHAEIRQDNPASQRCFERAGFRRVRQEAADLYYRFDYPSEG